MVRGVCFSAGGRGSGPGQTVVVQQQVNTVVAGSDALYRLQRLNERTARRFRAQQGGRIMSASGSAVFYLFPNADTRVYVLSLGQCLTEYAEAPVVDARDAVSLGRADARAAWATTPGPSR